MSFRFYNPAPVFHDLLGLDPCNGGSLTFCELGTTTPKGTWADQDQTIPNENPVPLDSAGRSNTNIWLDGGYTVTLRAGDGTVVWARDVDSGQGAGAALPPMEPGKFLTTDGSNWLLADVRQVPDPSGSPDTILGTDGANLIWTAKAEPPPAAEVSGVDKVIIKTGGDTDWMILKGQGTSPASGTQKSSLPVTFATAFKAGTTPNVTLIPSPGLQASGAVVVPYLSSVPTATGFTAAFDVAEGNPSEANVNTPIVFQWIAQGQVPAA
ncbi:hypothetical protein ABB26_04935 [Stenotrophomonas humi]|uniref:Uncharacterized protein n=1 Tax=Stenotrophomonas humi TaxID=405444 RepID=A0A0R0C628_9GAMM|nr:hypothetical protein [Stenotrophomonas humi]KRG65164.1 hypothetical protein ABB26_04935 [Stenotrophomonas humi]